MDATSQRGEAQSTIPCRAQRRSALPLLRKSSSSLGQTTWQKQGVEVLVSPRFQGLMALTIVANALVIGFETDIDWPYWDLIENFFLSLFTIELVLRITMYGPSFFFDRNELEFTWNMFDFSIVGLGLFDLACKVILRHSSSQGLATLFRVVRIIRIMRIFRIVRFLKQLYMLAFGLFDTAQAALWVAFITAVVLFVSSILLVRTVGQPDESAPQNELLVAKFGTVMQAMFTLFEIMSDPNLDLFKNVLWDHCLLAVFLIVFTMFASFGMIAILTGVVTENMLEKNQARIEEERVDRENKRHILQQGCKDLFDRLDLDPGGLATQAEITDLLPHVASLLQYYHIEYTQQDLDNVVEVMDVDVDDRISKNEFVQAILFIAEGVRPVSIMELQYHVSLLIDHVRTIEEELASSKSQRENEFDTMKTLAQNVDRLLDSQQRTEANAEWLASGETSMRKMQA